MEEQTTYIATGEHTATERRICYDFHAELPRGLQQVVLRVLNIESEDRIFNLDCCNRVDGVRAAKRVGAAFREAEVLDLARTVTVMAYKYDVQVPQ